MAACDVRRRRGEHLHRSNEAECLQDSRSRGEYHNDSHCCPRSNEAECLQDSRSRGEYLQQCLYHRCTCSGSFVRRNHGGCVQRRKQWQLFEREELRGKGNELEQCRKGNEQWW